ncbi:unnamed protein product [Dovyalis caffra]|uniref:Uncharacterized protein n=1 Tax=Dovyalis caffra TaxID=77055 RepID=A0AAV1RX88_9ROSI|nr:unnamed protein product [Dovyalis caffra]
MAHQMDGRLLAYFHASHLANIAGLPPPVERNPLEKAEMPIYKRKAKLESDVTVACGCFS